MNLQPNTLNRFDAITLEEMDSVALMNRTDTKFMLSIADLEDILKCLPLSYRMLEVDGIRENSYETLYYDTSDLYFYRRHHSGKKNRYKIRKRRYVESNLTFLEVKFKTNKDRTIKDRTRIPQVGQDLNEIEKKFIKEEATLEDEFVPILWNRFKRITLVNKEWHERLTIDLNLTFEVGDRAFVLENFVIAEVKQEKQNRHSPFMREVKRRLIREDSVSKYCLGVAMLFPEIKSNNFKAKIKKLMQIENGAA